MQPQPNRFHNPAACAKILKSISNIYRLQIIQLLMTGEKNVTELNAQVKVSQPALSQHLARLRKEGIVDTRRDQRQIFYRISNPNILRILAVVEDVAAKRELIDPAQANAPVVETLNDSGDLKKAA